MKGLKRLPRYIDCSHEKPEYWTSLIHLAQEPGAACELLVLLAQHGYLVYRAPVTGTSLILRSEVEHVWEPIKDREYDVNADGIVYKYTDSRHSGPPTSLIVVFSSVAKKRFSQRLDRHFPQVFETLIKAVSGHTAILRIADMDGVVGGFYLPTTRDPQSSEKIQQLIRTVVNNFLLPDENVVFYGASKGATGALFNGLAMNMKTVAIDPYVTNNRRLDPGADPYFTSSEIFSESFDDLFARSLRRYSEQGGYSGRFARHVLITSRNSAEFNDIRSLATNNQQAGLKIVESTDPHIGAHHQVASNTMSITLALMNGLAQGLPIELGEHTVVR